MKTYEARQAVTLGAGVVLKMSPTQAARRRHLLEDLGGGRHRARAPVQFKAGEVVGIEGPLPKALLGSLKELGPAAGAAGKAARTAMGRAVEAAKALI